MTNLGDKILQEIETKKIHPTAKILITGKRLLFWILAIMAGIIGGLGAGVIIFIFANQDWDVYLNFANI